MKPLVKRNLRRKLRNILSRRSMQNEQDSYSQGERVMAAFLPELMEASCPRASTSSAAESHGNATWIVLASTLHRSSTNIGVVLFTKNWSCFHPDASWCLWNLLVLWRNYVLGSSKTVVHQTDLFCGFCRTYDPPLS